MEKRLYSYPLIGSRMFCSFSFKESDRRRGNCGTHRAALLSPRLIWAQSKAEIHLAGIEVCTDLWEANGHHSPHLPPGPPGSLQVGRRVALEAQNSAQMGQRWDEQELAQGTASAAGRFSLLEREAFNKGMQS